MATSIADQIGEDDPLSTIATTLVAYALSSVLTGKILFFFPRLRATTALGTLGPLSFAHFLISLYCALLRHTFIEAKMGANSNLFF